MATKKIKDLTNEDMIGIHNKYYKIGVDHGFEPSCTDCPLRFKKFCMSTVKEILAVNELEKALEKEVEVDD